MTAPENAKIRTLPLPGGLSQLVDLTEDRPFPIGEGEPGESAFEGALFAWADAEMPPEDASRLREIFSQEALLAAWVSGERRIHFDFQTLEGGGRRLVMRFMTDDETGNALGVLSLYALPDKKAASDAVAVPLDVLALPYGAFAWCALDAEWNGPVKIVRDELKLFEGLPLQSAAALLEALREQRVFDAWREEYAARFSTEALQKAAAEGSRLISYAFATEKSRVRQDVYVFPGGGGTVLCVGLLREAEPADSALMLAENRQGIANAVADMQMEMQFARKEMKSHTRRVALALAVLALLAGCIGGAVLDRQGGIYTNILDQFFVQPTAEPEDTGEEAAPAATAAPVIPVYVARTGSASFTAEVSSNGTARTSTTISDYTSDTFTAQITDVLGPDDFASKYKKYTLDGTEACAALQLNFESVKDEDREVIPQDAFLISMVGSNGERVEEYQLMDKEIAGSYGVAVADGSKKTFYKRYVYSEDIDYLVLSYYVEGTRNDLYFALRYDDPNVTHDELKKGDKKLMVQYLKSKLTDLGYYSGKISQYFDDATQEAVKSAQKDLGLEETGVADCAFQQALYAREA